MWVGERPLAQTSKDYTQTDNGYEKLGLIWSVRVSVYVVYQTKVNFWENQIFQLGHMSPNHGRQVRSKGGRETIPTSTKSNPAYDTEFCLCTATKLPLF